MPDSPFGTISMIGVQHHFLDWRSAVRTLCPKLLPDGTSFFSEPCHNFMLISGLLASIFAHTAREKGMELDVRDQLSLRAMRNVTSLRCANGLSRKVSQEDKYAFQIDDIATAGKAMGYDVTWLPNGSFSDPAGERQEFRGIAPHRLSAINNSGETLMAQTGALLNDALDYLSEVGRTSADPYFDCMYVMSRT